MSKEDSKEVEGRDGHEVGWETEIIVQPATAVTKLRKIGSVEDVRTAVVVKMLLALRRDGPGGFATFRVTRREGVEYSPNQEILLFSPSPPFRWYSQHESGVVTDRLELLRNTVFYAMRAFKERGLTIEADSDAPEIDFSVDVAGEITRPPQGRV